MAEDFNDLLDQTETRAQALSVDSAMQEVEFLKETIETVKGDIEQRVEAFTDGAI